MGAQAGKADDAAAKPPEPDVGLSTKPAAAGAADAAAKPGSASSRAANPDAAGAAGGAAAEKKEDKGKDGKVVSKKEDKSPAIPTMPIATGLTDCVSSWGRFAGLSDEELRTTTGKGLVDGPVIGSMPGSVPKEEAVLAEAAKADAVLDAFYKLGVTYKHYRFEALKAREKTGGATHGYSKVIAEGNETIKEITEVKLRREGVVEKQFEDPKNVQIEKRSNMVTISFNNKTKIDSYTIKTGEGDAMYDPVRWKFMGSNSLNGEWSTLHAMEIDYDTPKDRRKFLSKSPPAPTKNERGEFVQQEIDPDDLIEWFYVTDLAATSGVEFEANLDGFEQRALKNSLESFEVSEHKELIEKLAKKGFDQDKRQTRVEKTVGTGKLAKREMEHESPLHWSHEDDVIKKYRSYYQEKHTEEIMELAYRQRSLRGELHEKRVVAREADRVQGANDDDATEASGSKPSMPESLASPWAQDQLGWKDQKFPQQNWDILDRDKQ